MWLCLNRILLFVSVVIFSSVLQSSIGNKVQFLVVIVGCVVVEVESESESKSESESELGRIQ